MYLKVAPEIRRALQGSRPVVALESTIITHGMPYPENLETARSLESQVRADHGGGDRGRADPFGSQRVGQIVAAQLEDILGGGQPLQFGIGKTGADHAANHRDGGRHLSL